MILVALAGAAAQACNGGGAQGREGPPDSATAVEATPVQTAPVEAGLAAEPVRATGVVAGKNETPLAFKVGGVVARVLVDEGDAVRAGQLLAVVDPAEIDAQVSKAESAAEQAGRDLARVRALYQDSVVTLAQLEQATTGARIAEADVRATRFNRRHATIVAPAAGVVLRRMAEPSEQVASGQSVLVVRGTAGGVVLRAGLADRDAVRVRRGDAATVRFDAYPGETFAARVTEIAAASTAGTGTYEIELSLDARGRALGSGLVGRAEIAAAAAGEVTFVPIEALVEADGDSATVYTLDGTGPTRRARRVPVSIAFVRGGQAALRPGAGLGGVREVITQGSAYVDDGAAVTVVGGGSPATGRRAKP